jgi:CRP-like cAMP-binding protein
MVDDVLKQRSPKLSISERIAASAYGAKAHWPSGFQLYQRDGVADGIFIVLHGHVILRSPIKGGRGFVSAIAMAGETFGAEGLSPTPVYCTDAHAAEGAETLHLGTSQFRAFVREQPAHALALVSQVMAERSALLNRL